MIKTSTKTEVKGQDAVDKFKKEAKKFTIQPFITVGVHGDAGEYESGVDVVQVALWNEFGTETSPERSFIRKTMDTQADKINKLRLYALNNIHDNKWTLEKALEFMGIQLTILIQNAIKSNTPPPNAPSTLAAKARKGTGSRTLMDSRLLLRSIGWKRGK